MDNTITSTRIEPSSKSESRWSMDDALSFIVLVGHRTRSYALCPAILPPAHSLAFTFACQPKCCMIRWILELDTAPQFFRPAARTRDGGSRLLSELLTAALFSMLYMNGEPLDTSLRLFRVKNDPFLINTIDSRCPGFVPNTRFFCYRSTHREGLCFTPVGTRKRRYRSSKPRNILPYPKIYPI